MATNFGVPTDNIDLNARRAEIAVFTSGVTSMGLEVLAGRIIAPVYGNSVYTWGGVLGVFMLALAAGYWIGGNRAEEHASASSLTKVMAYSVVSIGVVAALDQQIVEASTLVPLPAIYAPIVPLLVLFGPPTFILGFISPYGAELTKAESTGEASGRVYSLGTIGSIVGAFVTTYALIPYFSVLWIEVMMAVVLIVVAVLISFPPKTRTAVHMLIAILVMGAAIGYTPPAASASGEVVYETQTPYQHLKITDDDGVRTMYLNDHPQSAMYLNNETQYVFDYARYAHLSHLYRQNASLDRVLVIGAAGYSIPKRYLEEYPNITVDVVDIDREVVEAGKKYFNVSESDRLNTHVADARRYLRNTNKTYDAIILDAFQKDSVPFHLTTVEFMQLMSEHLDSQGVLIQNMITAAEGPRSQFARSEFETAQQVFPSAELYPVSDNPHSVQNVLLVATKGEDMRPRELRRRNRNRDIGINLSGAIEDYKAPREIDTSNVPILRDGDAPVDKLTEPLFDQPYVIQRANQSEASTAD